MINIDPKSWHARLYLWYLRESGSMLAHRALRGTYLCPYMRTLLIWLPLFIVLGLSLRFTFGALYFTFWGKGDWHFRPRWAWLGAIIGAPLLIPPTWQYQHGWAWWSDVAWGFGTIYVLLLLALSVAGILVLLLIPIMHLVDIYGGKQGVYRDARVVRRATKILAKPVPVPTVGFARLLYKYYQTFHTKICPRVQFMEAEAGEEE